MHAYNDQTARKDKATSWLLLQLQLWLLLLLLLQLLLQLLLKPRGVDASTVADGDADSTSAGV
jgi:hypothetical protein